MTIDVDAALSTLSLLRQHGFTVTWIDAEGMIRFEAPTTPPADVIAALDAHGQAIVALMKPDGTRFSGLDYRKVYDMRLEERLASGMGRDHAHTEAFEHALHVWLERDFELTARSASPSSCTYCGRPEGDDVLVPIGVRDPHHWLHSACYEVLESRAAREGRRRPCRVRPRRQRWA